MLQPVLAFPMPKDWSNPLGTILWGQWGQRHQTALIRIRRFFILRGMKGRMKKRRIRMRAVWGLCPNKGSSLSTNTFVSMYSVFELLLAGSVTLL